MSHADETYPHRLFAAIVLMGTGLTLGCGGVAEREGTGTTDTSHAGHGGNGTSSGGSAIGGGATTGGSDTISIGGGADPIVVTAGTGPMPVTPGPFECPPQQWSCEPEGCGLVGNGWPLPDGCACDPTRPEQASDCAPGKVFLCRRGTSTADGRTLAVDVPFDCHCVDKSMYFCQDECDLAYGVHDARCDGDEAALTALCGCAVVYLK